MSGREKKIGARTKVTYRLTTAQINRLETTSKAINKSKTAIVEEALGAYFTVLHENGVI